MELVRKIRQWNIFKWFQMMSLIFTRRANIDQLDIFLFEFFMQADIVGELYYMNLTLDRRSKIPLFIQIAEQLRDMIVTSRLNADTFLPSIRQMAEYLQVNRQTIHNAIRILEEEDLVEIRRGAGGPDARPPVATGARLLRVLE